MSCSHGWPAGWEESCPDCCRCGHIKIGMDTTDLRSWSDHCAEHGVGTDYFRNLPAMPFGYADERDTTREEWLAFLEER